MENSSNLKRYLNYKKIRQTELADFLCVKQSTVSCIVNGIKRPSINTATLIEIFTEGHIKLAHWSYFYGKDDQYKQSIKDSSKKIHAKADLRR